MGWNGLNSNKSFDEIFRNEFAEWLAYGNIRHYVECHVDPPYDHDTIDESEFFAAVRGNLGFTYCLIVIMKRLNSDNTVAYKVMDEFVGPFTINKCPVEIMELLTPLDQLDKNEYKGHSEEWRESQI